MGKPGFPISHCWERLAPPQAGGWGNPVSPYPTVGSGWRPHRQGDGETRFSRMFTSVIHAAGPHNAGMKILLGGLRPPKPSRGRVVSREGCALPNPPAGGLFPGRGRGAAAPRPYAQTLPRAGYVHIR